MPAAQMRRSPRSSGDGRLRASLAASLSHSRVYSASRCWVQNARVIAVISLKTGRTGAGSFGVPPESARLVTASILPGPAPSACRRRPYRVCRDPCGDRGGARRYAVVWHDGVVRHETALRRLRTIAERCQRVSGLWEQEPVLLAAYVFGAVLDGRTEVPVVQVAFVLDLPADELTWCTHPPSCAGLPRLLEIDKAPVDWYWRPAVRPVSNHAIHRPLRIWSTDGVDDAALAALARGRRSRCGCRRPPRSVRTSSWPPSWPRAWRICAGWSGTSGSGTGGVAIGAETKLHGEGADGSNPAQPGSAWMRRAGGGGQIDGVAEGLQLTDQPALGGVGVVAAGEVVSAQVAVAGVVV